MRAYRAAAATWLCALVAVAAGSIVIAHRLGGRTAAPIGAAEARRWPAQLGRLLAQDPSAVCRDLVSRATVARLESETGVDCPAYYAHAPWRVISVRGAYARDHRARVDLLVRVAVGARPYRRMAILVEEDHRWKLERFMDIDRAPPAPLGEPI